VSDEVGTAVSPAFRAFPDDRPPSRRYRSGHAATACTHARTAPGRTGQGRERAEVKEKLKLGSINLPELLTMAEGNETVGKMKVLSVLESLPGLGKVKARRLMETVGISESRRLQGLGSNQRESLLRETAR
jgi:hypothetical protein